MELHLENYKLLLKMFRAKAACITPKKCTRSLTECVRSTLGKNKQTNKIMKTVLEFLLLKVLMVTCFVISLWVFNKNFNNRSRRVVVPTSKKSSKSRKDWLKSWPEETDKWPEEVSTADFKKWGGRRVWHRKGWSSAYLLQEMLVQGKLWNGQAEKLPGEVSGMKILCG